MAAISTQSATSSSSISSSTPQGKYDVFLSFRGEDTRNRFTDHLYVALKQKDILTFRDEEKLETGKSISSELLKAIEKSRFAIVILSRNYASSTWCLDEFVKIIGCMKEIKMMVLPIFYDVDSSTIRKQMGTFAQAFTKHEENFKDCIEKVQAWRNALREVASLKGWHVQDRPELQIIQNIVGELWHKLSYAFLEYTKNLVGIISRTEKLESCLDLGSNNVRMVGIWGMGGIGKTTLARVVFCMVSNKFEDKFEGCCFLANVRGVCEKDGLVRLQQQLILQILNENMAIEDVNEGVFVIKNKLRHKKILLVLDDVDQLNQLNKLAGDHIWFGLGSRVIITTRDKHLLQTHGVDEIYEANGLTHAESLHLLSLKAFKKDYSPEDYLELSRNFVYYANDLPLAIEILGSFLFGRSIHQWKSTLNRLKQFPEKDILQVLRISFEGLHETENEIFLNIACFFNHGEKKDVVEILNYLDLFPDVGLGVLFDKYLVKFRGRTLWKHDLLQEMGKNIVYEECPKEPGKRGKLWLFKDINDVLSENTSFDSLKFINLKKSLKLIETPDLNKIPNLEKLVLKGCINLHSLHPSIGVHKKLTFLNLKGCKNLRSLPSKFEMECLEIFIFSGCSNLKRIPEFGENMESVSELYLDGAAITKLPTSIENLAGIVSLNVKDCINLMSLPSTFFNMKWLKDLNLFGCSKLLENLVTEKSVEELNASGIAIGLMPYSNALFHTLKRLAFGGFNQRSPNRMDLLLTSLSSLCFLTKLNLCYCILNAIPNDICCLFSLKYLCLSGNNFSCLPENIAQLSILNRLVVNNCTSLHLTNCSKLAENQGFIDMFFAMIIKCSQFLLSDMFPQYRYDIVIPGSEILKWFRHRSIGDEVSIQEPYSLLCNEWIGIAVSVVFGSHSHHQINSTETQIYCSLDCWLKANRKQIKSAPGIGEMVTLSDHIWLLYLLPQFYEKEDIKSLWECDANGFYQIGIKIEIYCLGLKMNKKIRGRVKVKKCGLRMAYKKDIEDLKRTMAERNNNSITPYVGLDVPHHNFDNSMAAAAKGYKAKRTRDDCDGAGSSNYEPHPKRIERLTKFMAQGNSNGEESSEYKECAEELADWQESSESDLEG
ncbi:hypothetical protein ACB092_11G030100 [Castanea dentata]